MAKRHSNNKGHVARQSMADVFASSKTGQKLYVEAKHRDRERQDRYQALREQAHSVFVSDIPKRVWFWRKLSLNYKVLRECFHSAKPAYRKLAEEGGSPYYEAVDALAHTWESPEALERACQALDLA